LVGKELGTWLKRDGKEQKKKVEMGGCGREGRKEGELNFF